MKILVLADTQTGGEWIATYRYLRYLKKQRSSTQFYLIGLNGQILQSRKVSFFQTVTNLHKSSAKPPFSFVKKFVKDVIQVRREIKKHLYKLAKEDQVYCTDYLMLLAFYSLPKSWKLDTTFSYHGQKGNLIKSVTDINYREIIIKTAELLALILARKITTPGLAGRKQIIRFLGPLAFFKKIEIVPNRLPAIFFRHFSQKELKLFQKEHYLHNGYYKILYCGRISEHKGLELLAQSFVKFSQLHPRSLLILAFPTDNLDSELMQYLDTTLSQTKNSRIVKLPNLSESNLAKLYQSVNLVTLLSESEIAPLCIQEALATRIRCLVSKKVELRTYSNEQLKLVTQLPDNSLTGVLSALKKLSRFTQSA